MSAAMPLLDVPGAIAAAERLRLQAGREIDPRRAVTGTSTVATAVVAAAIIGHLHMNVSRPGVDRSVAIREFMALVQVRVLRSLAADEVLPGDDGRWH